MPTSDSGIRIRFVTAPAWLRAASICGINIAPLMDEVGIDMSNGPMPMVSAQQLETLMQLCVRHAWPRYYFPLVAAETFVFDSIPVLSVFVATSPTGRQALPVLEWAGRVIPSLRLKMEEKGSRAMLVVDANTLLTDRNSNGYFTELTIAVFQKFARMLLGERAQAECIELRHDPGPYRAHCQSHFDAPIFVNRPRDLVVFNRSLLDVPLVSSFPQLHSQIKQTIQRDLPPAGSADLVGTIKQLLSSDPQLLAGGVGAVAARLNMHPRTLQRRLGTCGASLAELIAARRQLLAQQALSDGASDIEALSRSLGFSDRHSFTRAFRRWTGETPTAYRRRRSRPE